MRRLALIAVLAASPAAAASSVDAERSEAAERLAARARDALDGVLGPGRSKVEIDVVGEHSELNSDAELLFPVDKGPEKKKSKAEEDEAARLLDLPGYVKGKPVPTKEKREDKPEGPPPPAAYNKEHEASRHDAGFLVKSIHATIVLDSSLNETVVRDASQLLPQLLGLDMTRGDTLSILRAPLRPMWKLAFATPGDWRIAAYVVGGGIFLLLTAIIVFAGLVGAGRSLGRALGQEMANRRAEEENKPAAEELPELSPGAAGFLEGETAGSEPAAAAPLLGRRFDFLGGHDPDVIVRAVSTEKPEELSLFFGHLAESIPDLASRLFARLPPELQAEVSQAFLKLSVADPERLTAIEERLRQALVNGVMGPQSLGRMLSRVPGETRADLLGRLAARDARAAEEIEKHMFSFEDLDGLGPAALRRLLGEVPYETWGPALRGAPSGLIDAVLQDLPEGPRELVRAAVAEPQPRDKVEEARSKILDAYAALEAKGEMSLGGGAEKKGDLV